VSLARRSIQIYNEPLSMPTQRLKWKRIGPRICVVAALTVSGFKPQSIQLSREESKKVLDGYYSLIHNAKTITLEEGFGDEKVGFKETHWLMKPGLYRSFGKSSDGKGGGEEARTYMFGKMSYLVKLKEKTYDVFDRLPGSPFMNGFEPFFQTKRPAYTLKGKVFSGQFRDKPIYEIQTGEQSLPGSMVSVIVDRQTLRPVAWKYAWRGRDEVHEYRKVEFDLPMSKNDFVWTPPKGYKLRMDMRMSSVKKRGES
jgi:hypothetical protein